MFALFVRVRVRVRVRVASAVLIKNVKLYSVPVFAWYLTTQFDWTRGRVSSSECYAYGSPSESQSPIISHATAWCGIIVFSLCVARFRSRKCIYDHGSVHLPRETATSNAHVIVW